MTAELSLYISASSEADAECELIGRLLAEQVKTIRWRIWRTPLHGDINPDEAVISSSQFFVLLLATDLVAPMGVEWQMARRAGSFIMAFRNEAVPSSPAADYFYRNMGISWHGYKTRDVFIHVFEQELLSQLVNGTPGYGLDMTDIELVSARLQAVRAGGTPQEDQRHGAGQGGIILT